MRWRSLLLVVVAGCAQPKLQQAQGQLRVEPASLEVRAFVGFPVERRVSIFNAGRAPLSVEVSGSSGLTLLGGSALELSGGQTIEVTVLVGAGAAGALAQALGFTVEGVQTRVPVTGQIEAVPACGVAGECQAIHFDPTAGRCVEAPLADGSACAAACLTTASCQAGKCVGAARSCDDGNKCTQDSCSSDGSCVHLDTSASCAGLCESGECGPGGESATACQVPACDPVLGCTLVNVADGTACGANDCSTAHICMTGKCQVVTAPQGSVCSEATPCQSVGRCVANRCEATLHPIVPAWQVLDSAKVKRSLLGVVSPGGLIFGLERHDVGIFVVAYDGRGFERWRSPLYTEFWGTMALYDVARGQLVLISKTWARALDGVTGAQKWFVDLSSEIPLNNASSTGAKQVYPARISILPGSKRLVATYQEGSDVHVLWVFGLDLLTGQQAFKIRRDGHLYGMMTTSTDELFLGSAGCWAPASWNAAYDSAGAKRWETFQAGVPALTSGTRLYFQPYGSPSNFVGSIDLVTGAMSQEAQGDNKAILAEGSRLYLTSTLSPTSLTAWDVGQHLAKWTRGGVPLQQSFLTEGGGVLGLSSVAAAHVSAAGTLEWSCALGPLVTAQTASLVDGQVVAQTSQGIAGFAVGALKVSASGWSVSDRGNPERTSRSR